MFINVMYKKLVDDPDCTQFWNKPLSSYPKAYLKEREKYDITGNDYNESYINHLRITHKVYETYNDHPIHKAYKRLFLGGNYSVWHERQVNDDKTWCQDEITFKIITVERELTIVLLMATEVGQRTTKRLAGKVENPKVEFVKNPQQVLDKKDNKILVPVLEEIEVPLGDLQEELKNKLAITLNYFELQAINRILNAILPSIIHTHKKLSTKVRIREKFKK